MKAIDFSEFRKYLTPIGLVLALFLGGTSAFSEFIRAENNEHQAANEAAIIKHPKGNLTGWFVDIHYSFEQSTTGDGVPTSMYKRDYVIQDQYIVLPGFDPTTNLVDKEKPSIIPGFKVDSIYNIRKVGIVREHKESLDPKEPEEE